MRACLIFIAIIGLASPAFADDRLALGWTQFRGPNGSGLPTADKPLPKEIGPEKNQLWRAMLPEGHSSPVIGGGKLFLTTELDKKLMTVGLNADTGHIDWGQTAYTEALEEVHHIGSHAQASPVTDGERVVSFFGSCGLLCYDLAGKPLWNVRLGPFKNNYGAASSPLIVGDLVILNQDHDIDSFLLAVDKRTGHRVWQTDRGEFPRGFCTPIVWDNAGVPTLVVPGALRICGYDLKTGKELWTVRGTARICNMTPVIGPQNSLLVTEWAPGGDETDRIVAAPFTELTNKYDANKNKLIDKTELPPGQLGSRFDQMDRNKNGQITAEEYDWARALFNTAENAILAIRPGGAGDISKTHVDWKANKLLPYVPSPIFYRGLLFMVKSGGIASCVDATTGKPVKQVRLKHGADYFSSPVIGDGRMIVIDKNGGATVLSADREMKVISSADFGESAFATPAIEDGRIYLRTSGHVYCFALSAK